VKLAALALKLESAHAWAGMHAKGRVCVCAHARVGMHKRVSACDRGEWMDARVSTGNSQGL
jgi:hypothetical protein